MIYPLLQFLMRLSLSAHYKRMFVDGKRWIPKDGPLLIAATHPNSFLDAIILGAIIDRPLYFLARSDVFSTKIADYILRKLNLIPIYRLQEGHENLNRNDETFRVCYELLEQGAAVLIFAEGISLTDRQVRKPKKGLARIGFGAEKRNDFKLGIQVLPIGLNYEEATGFSNRVLVHLTPPFSINTWQALYEETPNKAYEALNKKLYEALRFSSVEIEESEDELFEYLSWQISDKRFQLGQLKSLAHSMRQLKEQNEKAYLDLKKSAMALKKRFGKSPLQFPDFENKRKAKIFYMAVQALPGILGYLLNRLPFLIGHQIAKHTVKLPEFFAAIKIVCTTLIWLIYAGILAAYLAAHFSPWFYILTPFILFALGKSYQGFAKESLYLKSQIRTRQANQLDPKSALGEAKKQVGEFMMQSIPPLS